MPETEIEEKRIFFPPDKIQTMKKDIALFSVGQVPKKEELSEEEKLKRIEELMAEQKEKKEKEELLGAELEKEREKAIVEAIEGLGKEEPPAKEPEKEEVQPIKKVEVPEAVSEPKKESEENLRQAVGRLRSELNSREIKLRELRQKIESLESRKITSPQEPRIFDREKIKLKEEIRRLIQERERLKDKLFSLEEAKKKYLESEREEAERREKETRLKGKLMERLRELKRKKDQFTSRKDILEQEYQDILEKEKMVEQRLRRIEDLERKTKDETERREIEEERRGVEEERRGIEDRKWATEDQKKKIEKDLAEAENRYLVFWTEIRKEKALKEKGEKLREEEEQTTQKREEFFQEAEALLKGAKIGLKKIKAGWSSFPETEEKEEEIKKEAEKEELEPEIKEGVLEEIELKEPKEEEEIEKEPAKEEFLAKEEIAKEEEKPTVEETEKKLVVKSEEKPEVKQEVKQEEKPSAEEIEKIKEAISALKEGAETAPPSPLGREEISSEEESKKLADIIQSRIREKETKEVREEIYREREEKEAEEEGARLQAQKQRIEEIKKGFTQAQKIEEEERKRFLARIGGKKEEFAAPFPSALEDKAEAFRPAAKPQTFWEKFGMRIVVGVVSLAILALIGSFWYWFLVIRVDQEPPRGLTSLSVSSLTENSATLSWSRVQEKNFSHYEIWYGENQGDVKSRIAPAKEWDDNSDSNLAKIETTSTTITGLLPSATYHFKIWAVDKRNNEETTDLALATTLTPPPPTPAPLPSPPPDLITFDKSTDVRKVKSTEEIKTVIEAALKEPRFPRALQRVLIERDGQYPSLQEFLSAYGITPPAGFFEGLTENYNIFVYSLTGKVSANRLGFIVKMKSGESGNLDAVMKEWAKGQKMEVDWNSFFATMGKKGPGATTEFKSDTYRATKYYYQILIRGSLGIIYAFHQATDMFIFTSSGSSLFAVIDKLLSPK